LATDPNFHSWAVGWLKIILPMSALALLSTLFLFARNPANQSQDIPLAQIEQIAEDQRITAPQFSGVADDGSIIVIRAKDAKPETGNSDTLFVDSLTIDLDAPDGTHLSVTSGTSIIDGAAQTARLEGLSRVTTSSGYTMETNGLSADLKTGEITSDGRLAVMTPFGELTAGKVRFLASPTGLGQQMVFSDGVRLLYTPSGETP